MTVLQSKVRDELFRLIQQEIHMVDQRAQVVAEQHWKIAEHEVAKRHGYDAVLVRMEYLRNQITAMQAELASLEGEVKERAQRPAIQQYLDAGIEVTADQWGNIRPTPTVFGRELRSVWDLEVFTWLNERINFFQVYRTIKDLGHSVKRELLLAGTYEEARATYQRFHEKVTTAIGTEMPGLLASIENIPALKSPDDT